MNKRKRKIDWKRTTHTWDSFMDFCETTPSHESWVDYGNNTSSTHEPDKWTGHANYKETIDMALYGWPEGMKKVERIETEHTHALQDHENINLESNVFGFAPIVPNVLAGVPDTMFYFETTTKPMPIIKIVCTPCCNAGVSGNKLIEYGVAVMSLVDHVEQENVGVELVMQYPIKGSGRNILLQVNLKEAGQPLDRDRIVFALAHPSSFRRMVFRWIEQKDNFDSHRSGHGQAASGDQVPVEKNALNIRAIEDMRNMTFSEILAEIKDLYKVFAEEKTT